MSKKSRKGKRRTREGFRRRKPDLGYYIIITDTKRTEENYLKGLRNSLSKKFPGRLVIKVFKVKTEKLVQECKDKAESEPQYREPWIVFDRDEVKNFDDIIKEAEEESIKVGWSNPCIEIWFEAYFGKMNPNQDSINCERAFSSIFKKKTGQEYKKSDKNIYTLLASYGDEESAVKKAEFQHWQHLKKGNDKPSKMCPCTTVYQLIKEIKEKTRNSDTSVPKPKTLKH